MNARSNPIHGKRFTPGYLNCFTRVFLRKNEGGFRGSNMGDSVTLTMVAVATVARGLNVDLRQAEQGNFSGVESAPWSIQRGGWRLASPSTE